MKRILLVFSLLIAIASKAQTINFSQMCVLNISVDSANDQMDVIIYNGSSDNVNYPTVVVVDAVGDTVGNINNTFYFFAQLAGDTVTHTIPTSLDTLPSGFTGAVYFTDQIWDTTYMFSFPMTCTVGINEAFAMNSINIYPNPADDIINVEFSNANASEVNIRIFDLLGKEQRTTSTTGTSITINSSDLQSGMYIISILIDGKSYTHKLVIR